MNITRIVRILNSGLTLLVLGILSHLPVGHPTNHHVAHRLTGGQIAKVEVTTCKVPYLPVGLHTAKVYHEPSHVPKPLPWNSLATASSRWIRSLTRMDTRDPGATRGVLRAARCTGSYGADLKPVHVPSRSTTSLRVSRNAENTLYGCYRKLIGNGDNQNAQPDFEARIFIMGHNSEV